MMGTVSMEHRDNQERMKELAEKLPLEEIAIALIKRDFRVDNVTQEFEPYRERFVVEATTNKGVHITLDVEELKY
jgi:hypothetical protein